MYKNNNKWTLLFVSRESTGKRSRYHIWSAASQARVAQRLEELCEHGQARASQHWSPEGKRSGVRKRRTFHLPRSGTICVQPGEHWHCIEETAERRGGARMGLPERCDATFSWNWIYRVQIFAHDEWSPPQFTALMRQGRVIVYSNYKRSGNKGKSDKSDR